MPQINLTITGTGSYLPATVLLSTDIDDRMGWERGECEARCGIAARHVAMPDETTAFMGAEAARRAMEMAGCKPADLDMILGACGVSGQPGPPAAALVQERLGLAGSGIPAFDVNATCLGFLQALDLAATHVQCGRVRRVLVFSSDTASVGLDWNRPEAAAIYGDGAAAVVVEAGGRGAVLAHDFQTYAHGHETGMRAAGDARNDPIRGIAPGEGRFHMEGCKAFKLASRYLPRFLQRLLKKADVGLNGIGCVIPHQASAQALQHATRNLWLPPERVVDIFSRAGNQLAASIPTALDHAVRTRRLVRGDTALLMGTSAGISLGGTLVRF
ncbi:3-oxoacyl-[acyl-carrier-protein] synthase III C-terminal domain-containing protein [Paracoccus simplex]|uniref:3-oxoacyl-[acyl-carrier-protein] synthase III C-terminal domain-containing protein n=1 Tax=Paracoccus simplex TaxID=2086346 RepID=A0ABV7RZ81_9RHOB